MIVSLALISVALAVVAVEPVEGVWLSARAGAGVVDNDGVMAVGAGVGFETVPVAVHLQVPLTLRVLDFPPAPSASLPGGCGAIRCEEWLVRNELSVEALSRIVEDVRVFEAGDVFHLRGGRLYATLGHGQLVRGYTNGADWDRRKSGLYVETNLPWGMTAVQAFAGSFLAPQELFGARVGVSPMSRVDAVTDSERFLGRLRVGFEVAGDAVAPAGDATDLVGDVVAGSGTVPTVGVAGDVSWPLLETGALQIEPWIAASTLLRADIGVGSRVGLDVTFDVAFAAVRGGGYFVVDGPGHRSAVFSTLYDIDRKGYALASEANTGFSSTGLAEQALPGGMGGGGSLALTVLDIVRVGTRLHVDRVPEASQLEMFTDVTAGPVRVGGRALERAFNDAAGAFTYGNRTFVIVEGAWAVFPPFSLTARWLHGPRFSPIGFPLADDDIIVGASFDLILESGA